MRAVGVVAALSLLMVPGLAHAREGVAGLVAQLNEMVRSEKTAYSLAVVGQAGNKVLVLDSISKLDGKHFRYSAAANDLNPSKIYWAPDNTIFVECVASARCVKSIDATSGQKLISFDFVSIGPFSTTPASRENALAIVKQMVTLAKATPQ